VPEIKPLRYLPAEYALIARHVESLTAYVERRQATGGFLQAVLANNLVDAAMRADHNSLTHLGVIARFVFNELPTACYGSAQKAEDWLSGKTQYARLTI
jgi:hypothetical protein